MTLFSCSILFSSDRVGDFHPFFISSLVGLNSSGRHSPEAISLRTATLIAIHAAVIEAHLVPPSAFNTSQSIVRAIGPNAFRSIDPLRDLAINRSISWVLPFAPLRSLLNLVSVEPGKREYSA